MTAPSPPLDDAEFAPMLTPLVLTLVGAAASAPTGAITGKVAAVPGLPLAGVEVLLLADATGYPLGRRSKGSVFEPDERGRRDVLGDWWMERTDGTGAFRFDGVPPGTYRLVAQSWRDGDVEAPRQGDEGKPTVLRPAITTDLRGFKGGVEVEGPGPTAIELEPPGDGILVYDRGAPNDDVYLALSLAPLAGDPILGFVAWRGPFAANAVGLVRMQGGQCVVRGVPRRHVHFSVFGNDNTPGFATGSFRGNLRRIHTSSANMVAPWSDGRHDPPERLAPVVAAVREAFDAGGPDAVYARLAVGREEAWAALQERADRVQPWEVVDVLGPLDRRVALAEGGPTHTVGDLLAAQAYHLLRRR